MLLELSNFSKDSSLKSGLTSQCKSCRKKRKDLWVENNKTKVTEYGKQYRISNAEKIKKENKVYCKNYYYNNTQKLKEYQIKYTVNNREKVNARNAKRRAMKLLATPSWVLENPEELSKIEGLYKKAKELSITTGIPHDVDHIIPLQGKYVSGFHCFSNLQVIPSTTNTKKGNRHESDNNFQ